MKQLRPSWLESMSLHSLANNLSLTALVLTKSAACMVTASLSLQQIVFWRPRLWSSWTTQWDPTALGLFCFILTINPLWDPNIAGASVQTPTSSSCFITLLSKNGATTLNTSFASVVVSRGLKTAFPPKLKKIRQNKNIPTTRQH